ncbi:MAG: anti-sigma F factor [Eubacteriales bacterium]|nr:anti-sigma F factor [Eubacteriales bacterium]
MKVTNEMKVQFLSRSVNEGFARLAAAAMVMQCDPTLEELSDIKVAVSEAVTNSIVHGYPGVTGFINMECRLFEDGLVEISVIDYGRGIEDVDKARQPLFTTNSDGERSGMGFTVMETFMDSVQVESALGRGTRVVMQKRLTPR